jgi:hypothetical protein
MADSRVEKWRKWIDGRIFQGFAMMNLHRDTYRKVQGIVEENDQLPGSYFLEFLQDHYASVQAMAIRRQADTDPRVISLGRLMAEISEDAHRLTREEFVALWSDDRKWVGQQAFDALAGEDGTHLDPAIPSQDCADLTASSEMGGGPSGQVGALYGSGGATDASEADRGWGVDSVTVRGIAIETDAAAWLGG